jgi:hypothetical protein
MNISAKEQIGKMEKKNRYLNTDLIKLQGPVETGPCYIDGLISTGNAIPFTILKIYFSMWKLLGNYFIHIFFLDVNYFEPNQQFKNWIHCDSTEKIGLNQMLN